MVNRWLIITGWWFRTWLLFFPSYLGMSSSQLTFTHIFQRGGSTTNQYIIHCQNIVIIYIHIYIYIYIICYYNYIHCVYNYDISTRALGLSQEKLAPQDAKRSQEVKVKMLMLPGRLAPKGIWGWGALGIFNGDYPLVI